MTEADIARLVQPACAIPPLAGLIRDGRGGFFLCSITQNAIPRLLPDNRLVTVIQDDRLSFPNAPSIAPDGSLYVPCSQVQRLPMFFKDKVSRVKGKFEVVKIVGVA